MAKTAVLSTRLAPEQRKRLERKARRMGRSASEAGAMLIEEGLRRDEFAFLDFRDSAVGRQAYVQGSTLAVWEVVWIGKGYGWDVDKTAEHLKLPPMKVAAALHYWKAFPKEIKAAIDEHKQADLSSLLRMLPQTKVFIAGGGK